MTPTIARETGHSLPTKYGVLKRFQQRGICGKQGEIG